MEWCSNCIKNMCSFSFSQTIFFLMHHSDSRWNNVLPEVHFQLKGFFWYQLYVVGVQILECLNKYRF